MALKDLIQKIIAEAEKKAGVIVAEAQPEIDAIKTAEMEAAASEKQNIEAKAKVAKQDIETKIHAMARREAQKAEQQARRAVLDEAFVAFVGHLNKSTGDGREAILKKLLSRIQSTNSTTYRVSSADKKSLDTLVKSGTVKEDSAVKSGFIAEQDGAVIDCTFENLIQSECRSDLEIYFAEQLKLRA